jgi:hypothetical protein
MVVIMVCIVQIDKKWFENMIGWYHEYIMMASTNGGNFINCRIARGFDGVNDTLKTCISGTSLSFDSAVFKIRVYLSSLIKKLLCNKNKKKLNYSLIE